VRGKRERRERRGTGTDLDGATLDGGGVRVERRHLRGVAERVL